MRAMYLLGVFAFLAVLGTAAAGPQDDILQKLQGKWQFTEQTMSGQQVPAETLKTHTITFKNDQWTVHDGDKVVQAGSHKFDTTKKPVQIDAKVTEGEGKGNTMLGICDLQGDTMKVCFDPTGKERPTSFTAKGDQFSATVKRIKK